MAKGLIGAALYGLAIWGMSSPVAPIRTLCAVFLLACMSTIIGWWLYGCARFVYPPKHDGMFYE